MHKQFAYWFVASICIFFCAALQTNAQGEITSPANFILRDVSRNRQSNTLEIEIEEDITSDITRYSITLYDLSSGQVLGVPREFDQPQNETLVKFSIPLDQFQIGGDVYRVEVRIVATDALGFSVQKSQILVINSALTPSATPAITSIPDASTQVTNDGLNRVLVAVIVTGVLTLILFVVRRREQINPNEKDLPQSHIASRSGTQNEIESISTSVSHEAISARPKVFISYRRKPSAMLATLLARELSNYQIDAFVDTRQSDGGGPFPTRLLTGIYNSDVFVCLLADTTLESEWVNREIQEAVSLNKVMIPIFQESYTPPSPPLAKPIEALLQSDGIHVLDIKNIYIDQAIADLAKMIKATYQEQKHP